MNVRHLAAIAALGVVLAGCGGGSTGASATTGTQAADLVGSEVVALISVNTDREGDQWKQADALLSRFPGRARLLAEVRKQLDAENLDWETEVAPALGPELDVAVAYAAGAAQPGVALLVKPDDPEKLKALIAKERTKGTVSRALKDGWWAVSGKAADLAGVLAKDGAPTLAQQDDFQAATSDQAGESILEAYVNGPRIREVAPAAVRQQLGSIPLLDSLGGIVASLQAVDDGLKLHGLARGDAGTGAKPFTSTFLREVPAGALLFATVNGGSVTANLSRLRQSLGPALAQAEQRLGIRLEDVQQLLAGEIALYVRPGFLLPEVTLVATTSDEARARRTLDALAARLTALLGGKTTQVEAGGYTFTQIPIRGFNLSYAVGKGRILLTDLPSGAARLGAGGDSLGDDPDFQAAVDAAGMPDATTGFAYVNVADALAALEPLAGDQVPAEVRENLRPLRTLLLFGAQEGHRATVGGFLGISG
jgi:hypothetical protein